MSWTRRPARPLLTRVVTPLLVLAALLVGAHAPAVAADSSTLLSGQTLTAGGALRSPSGSTVLTLQTDGNLVLYAGSTALWWTGTQGTPSTSLVLQGDGNLVLYTAAGVPTWNAGTRNSGATRLVVQEDGNLVLYTATDRAPWSTNTRQVPAPVSIGDRLTTGVAITPARLLTSRSGGYTLTLTGGVLVLSQGSVSLWTSTNGGGTGTSAVLQSDGNFVLYGSNGAVWNAGTRGSGATQVVLQDDGDLVLSTASGGVVWHTGTATGSRPTAGADRLLPGQTMRGGDTLTAVGGAYRLLQQTDGNLVVYGPSGPTWSANTRGWPTVRTTVQSDGNVVVYSGSDLALYNTGTRTGTANVLIMQGDGNLVLYAPSGPVWSSFYSPRPPALFPPVTAPPPTATSHYLRGLKGTSADLTAMQTMGCTDGRANPAGNRYITFLAYGAQTSSVTGSWGVQLTASTGRITNGAVVAATNAYVDGYVSCMAAASWLTVSVGTNNDGEDAGLGQTGGQIWAQQVVNPAVAHAAGRPVTIAGANDIEPGFNGSVAQAGAWMAGFLGGTSAPFVWTGSADGCPQSGPSNAACNYGWTPRNLYDLTYGASAGRSLPLPQIYYTSQAKQWVNISQIGQIQWGQRVQYAGPLTEVVACAQANSCYSMGAVDAWNTFWNLLNANSATRQTELPYTTDIRIDS